jgi:hypothetical protein
VRKRIIIGLLAVVVIGVGVFFLSQPKKGSVEYHKREYLATLDKLFGRRWVDRVWSYLDKAGARRERLSSEEKDGLELRLVRHQRSLIDLGFLVERQFPVSNVSASNVQREISWTWLSRLGEERTLFTWVKGNPGTTNTVRVIGRAEHMPFWESLIGEFDMLPPRSMLRERSTRH